MPFRVSARRWWTVATLIALAACGGGGSTMRPLRIAVTESSGDLTFSLEEPVRAIACVERDFRRSPGDPAAVRLIWQARCTADCRSAIRYADSSLESIQRAAPLAPSGDGACYICELTGDHGRGVTRFRVPPGGGFEHCRPSVGNL